MRQRGEFRRLPAVTAAFAISLALSSSALNASGVGGSDSCLTATELESLRQKNTATLRVLQFDEVTERSVEYVDVMREVRVAREGVDTCRRESERRLSDALGIPSCNAEIRNHNQLLQKANSIASYVKTRMDIINKMLELNRMTFRACD